MSKASVVSVVLVILSFSLISCQPISVSTIKPQGAKNAVVTNPSIEVTKELERNISAALDGIHITLSETAFTNQSHLSLTPSRQRTIKKKFYRYGNLLEVEPSYQFELYIKDGKCYIYYINTQKLNAKIEVYALSSKVQCAQ